jgi:hypothetical protein
VSGHRLAAVVVAAVVPRPALWWVAVRQWRRTVPDGWWQRWPFLPLPPKEYIAFRMVTQYGADEQAPRRGDVVDYLAWCKGRR